MSDNCMIYCCGSCCDRCREGGPPLEIIGGVGCGCKCHEDYCDDEGEDREDYPVSEGY